MSVNHRVVAVSALTALALAGTLATPAFFPQVFANEPQHQLLRSARDIFPPSFDTRRLAKFDITFDDSVSTEVTRTQIVKKIGFGHKSTVAVVTTPSGTYSSDGLASPYVRYPGIEVTPKRHGGASFGFSSFSSLHGTGTWTRLGAGSFVFYTYSFTRTRR